MAKRSVERRPLTKSSVGEMRERVSIETRVTVPPDFDQPENTISYSVLAEVWAKVDSQLAFVSPGEQIYNGVNLNKAPALRFTIRYRDDITFSNNVVRWRGNLYSIDRVDSPEERLEYIQLISVLRGADDKRANQ